MRVSTIWVIGGKATCPTLIGVAVWLVTASVRALETVYSFQLGPQNPQAGLVVGNDGKLHGTTYAGGSGGYGTAFSMAKEGTNFNFTSFGYTNGANPAAALEPAFTGSNILYGTAYQGGTNGFGSIFQLMNGSINTLVAFDGTNGAYPFGRLLSTNGYFYGTTYAGGDGIAGRFLGYGTVFKVNATNGTFSNLVSFDEVNGSGPQGSLVLGRDGNLYGTTAFGGASSNGTAFKMSAGGTLTSLLSFTFANGANPCGDLVEGATNMLFFGTSNLFFGTTASGGSSSNGTVFVMTTDGDLATLVSFNGLNGSNPRAGLVLSTNGYFYGTTYTGGANGEGTIFRMTAGGTLTTLISFNYVNGANPVGTLAQDTNGDFYGTTSSGGVFGAGTAFRLTPDGQLTTLVSFNPGAGFPTTGLLAANNGVLYGTATYGVSNNATVFGIDPGETNLSLLVPLPSSINADPEGILLQDMDGNVYGTTYGGGATGNGTVFRLMTTNGAVTNIFTFSSSNSVVTGSHPFGGLVEDANGSLYGAASLGGPTDTGTVFKIVPGPTNVFTTLALFINYAYGSGAFPEGPLVEGTASNYYGTTADGGTEGYGTIFTVTVNTNGSTLTTLVSFAYTNGSDPESGLVRGSDGNFYGTTVAGGANGYGTVFQMTTNLALNTLVSFGGTNGSGPQGPLLQGTDGNFYGTSESGGAYGYGTVFCVSPPGVWTNLTTVATFDQTNYGAYPNGGLVLAADDNIYGTTTQGGADGAGTVFRLWPALNCSLTNGNQIILSWSTNFVGFSVQSTTNLSPPVWGGSYSNSPAGTQFVVSDTISNTMRFYRLVSTNQ